MPLELAACPPEAVGGSEGGKGRRSGQQVPRGSGGPVSDALVSEAPSKASFSPTAETQESQKRHLGASLVA